MTLGCSNATPNRLEDSHSSSVISLQITQTRRLKWCPICSGSGWLGLFSSLEIFSQRLRGGLLSNDKSRALKSEQPTVYGCRGGLFIATGQPDLICPKWPWVIKELTRVTTERFQMHAPAWLGLQVKLTYPTQDNICSHCLRSKT